MSDVVPSSCPLGRCFRVFGVQDVKNVAFLRRRVDDVDALRRADDVAHLGKFRDLQENALHRCVPFLG